MKTWLTIAWLITSLNGFSWGFYAHKKINYYAVFLLPPEMLVLYKPQIEFLSEHAVDPDKRRYALLQEAPRHYIDMDHYGAWPYQDLPRKWNEACGKFGEDSLNAHGTVPWWIQTMLPRLTNAFREKNQSAILKLSAEIGHYIADAHVPLHTSSNHNGQLTNQKGIHGFWESRIPELLAETEWDFFIGTAKYLTAPLDFTWKRVLESARLSDTVLRAEKQLTSIFPPDQKYAFEERNGMIVRQYSTAFSKAYDGILKGMIEKRMRESIYAVASFWYTAWINAGQPDLRKLVNKDFSEEDKKEFEALNNAWKNSTGEEHN
jgi:hypothetical protein